MDNDWTNQMASNQTTWGMLRYFWNILKQLLIRKFWWGTAKSTPSWFNWEKSWIFWHVPTQYMYICYLMIHVLSTRAREELHDAIKRNVRLAHASVAEPAGRNYVETGLKSYETGSQESRRIIETYRSNVCLSGFHRGSSRGSARSLLWGALRAWIVSCKNLVPIWNLCSAQLQEQNEVLRAVESSEYRRSLKGKRGLDMFRLDIWWYLGHGWRWQVTREKDMNNRITAETLLQLCLPRHPTRPADPKVPLQWGDVHLYKLSWSMQTHADSEAASTLYTACEEMHRRNAEP